MKFQNTATCGKGYPMSTVVLFVLALLACIAVVVAMFQDR
jgi:hypothetical protein